MQGIATGIANPLAVPMNTRKTIGENSIANGSRLACRGDLGESTTSGSWFGFPKGSVWQDVRMTKGLG
jgi:hypothetical protein